MTLDSF